MALLAVIGLDEPVVQRLRERVDARLVAYPSVPPIDARAGRARVESARVAGKFLEPDCVVYYSYFEDASDARRALAMASTPSFPDVRATLPLDDKVLALVAALRADGHDEPRGYTPSGARVEVSGDSVFKWGNRHCGEGKRRVSGPFVADEAGVIEAFVEGSSERILLVGDSVWHLRYESADWRKNVQSTVSVLPQPDRALTERARRVATGLGLVVAGIDFVVGSNRATLLEVNAYPGLDDAPDANEAFVDLAAQWFERAAPAPPP